MRLRVKAVQEFDQMYYEPEYKAKCHKRVWKRLGRYIFGISYQSYLDYLKMDVSAFPGNPCSRLLPGRAPGKPNSSWWTNCWSANLSG